MEQNLEPPNKLAFISQLVLDKAVKSTEWGKDSLSNKLCWENQIFIFKK